MVHKLQFLKAKSEMAALAMRASLLLLRVKAGFNPNQPRVPAGNPDGGQWTDGAAPAARPRQGGVEDAPGLTERIVRDRSGEMPWRAYVEALRGDGTHISTTVHSRSGSRIVSEHPSPGTERNTVTLPSGERVVFENDGAMQRIFDADGRPISEAVWTPEGPTTNPIAQAIFFDSRKPGQKPSIFKTPAEVILDAGIELYNWWLSTQEPDENVVFSFRADELQPVPGEPPLWTSGLSREDVTDACPRFPLVQSMTNNVAGSLNLNQFRNRGAYGTAVHMGVKAMIDAIGDPNFRSEISLLKSKADEERYGLKGTVRIDILERRTDDAVCVYDLKTGRAGLSRARLLEIFYNVAAKYRTAGE